MRCNPRQSLKMQYATADSNENKGDNVISSELSRDCRNSQRIMRHFQGLTCSTSIIMECIALEPKVTASAGPAECMTSGSNKGPVECVTETHQVRVVRLAGSSSASTRPSAVVLI